VGEKEEYYPGVEGGAEHILYRSGHVSYRHCTIDYRYLCLEESSARSYTVLYFSYITKHSHSFKKKEIFPHMILTVPSTVVA
jgi:hypothetical protein